MWSRSLIRHLATPRALSASRPHPRYPRSRIPVVYLQRCLNKYIIGQLSGAVPINVGVQTEPRVSLPEFIISCRTHGGPAKEVSWLKHITLVEGSQYFYVYIIQTSQTILDTSSRSVYDNKLFVRGRAGGEYFPVPLGTTFPLQLVPTRQLSQVKDNG